MSTYLCLEKCNGQSHPQTDNVRLISCRFWPRERYAPAMPAGFAHLFVDGADKPTKPCGQCEACKAVAAEALA